MAQTVTWNGTNYSVPDVNDTGWGAGLTSYLVALPAGALQKTGGAFTLTADVDFGASFGVISSYLKSRSASIATAGVVRLAATDAIEWSTSNYALTTDGSGNLTWRGSKIAGSSGAVSSITGTAHQVIASAATGDITLSLPQGVDTTSTPTFASETLTAVTNQLILGTTRTVTITAPTPASTSRTWTIPDISGNGTFAALEGAQTFSGVKTFSANVLATSSMAIGTANIKARLTVVDNSSGNTTPGTNPILWIGGGNTNANTLSEIGFIYGATGGYSETNPPATIGYQVISGSGDTKGDLTFCTRNVTTDTAPTERFRIHAAGDSLFSGNLGFSSTSTQGIVGTTTNDSAAAGNVGEAVRSYLASGSAVNSTGSTNWDNLTSISLTAGDWDITGQGVFSLGTATGLTRQIVAVSTNSGGTTTDHVHGDNENDAFLATSSATGIAVVAAYRLSINSTTTVYLKARHSFSGGTPSAYGRISARRVR